MISQDADAKGGATSKGSPRNRILAREIYSTGLENVFDRALFFREFVDEMAFDIFAIRRSSFLSQ